MLFANINTNANINANINININANANINAKVLNKSSIYGLKAIRAFAWSYCGRYSILAKAVIGNRKVLMLIINALLRLLY
jgi:hypothetical protein